MCFPCSPPGHYNCNCRSSIGTVTGKRSRLLMLLHDLFGEVLYRFLTFFLFVCVFGYFCFWFVGSVSNR